MKFFMLIQLGLKMIMSESSACRDKLSTTQLIIGLPVECRLPISGFQGFLSGPKLFKEGLHEGQRVYLLHEYMGPQGDV